MMTLSYLAYPSQNSQKTPNKLRLISLTSSRKPSILALPKSELKAFSHQPPRKKLPELLSGPSLIYYPTGLRPLWRWKSYQIHLWVPSLWHWNSLGPRKHIVDLFWVKAIDDWPLGQDASDPDHLSGLGGSSETQLGIAANAAGREQVFEFEQQHWRLWKEARWTDGQIIYCAWSFCKKTYILRWMCSENETYQIKNWDLNFSKKE